MNLPSQEQVNNFVKSDSNFWKRLGEGIDKVCFEFDADFVICFLKYNQEDNYWTQLLIDYGIMIGQYYDIDQFNYHHEDYKSFSSVGVYIVEKLNTEFEICELSEHLQQMFGMFYSRFNPYKRSESHLYNLWTEYFPDIHNIIVEFNLQKRWDGHSGNFGLNCYGEIIPFDVINI